MFIYPKSCDKLTIILIGHALVMCMGYLGPSISPDNPEISRDEKSKDICCLKIAGFFNNIPVYHVGFYDGFLTRFIDKKCLQRA